VPVGHAVKDANVLLANYPADGYTTHAMSANSGITTTGTAVSCELAHITQRVFG